MIFAQFNLCKTFHVLPKTGGLLDQPGLLIDYFTVIESQIQKETEIKRREMESKNLAAR